MMDLARFAADHFVLSTTTANAGKIISISARAPSAVA